MTDFTRRTLVKGGSADITFPNSWKVTKIRRGLETSTSDGEVYLWAAGSCGTWRLCRSART